MNVMLKTNYSKHPLGNTKNRPSDRVREKIKNYAGIFRQIMQNIMLITWKTHWIMRKFKQFITLIIVSFHRFFCYLNCLVRFLLLLCLFKFILTISLNHKMILWDDERAKEDNMFKFPHTSTSQMQFPTVIPWNVNAFCSIEISVRIKLVPRLIAKRRMERLEVKNCSWTKPHVFVDV